MENPPWIVGTVNYRFWSYQDENLKVVIQQYRVWSDYTDTSRWELDVGHPTVQSLVRLHGCAG